MLRSAFSAPRARRVSAAVPIAAVVAGLFSLHCGPPVATVPPPTPVYAEQLSLPPAEVLHESMHGDGDEPKATAPAPAPSEEPTAPEDSEAPAAEDDGAGSPSDAAPEAAE